MICLVTADWHIRSTVPSCIDATPGQWMSEQKRVLDKLVEIVKEEQVEQVLIGGDVFHSENTTSFECIQIVQDFAKKIIDYDTSVWVLCGNHDLPGHSSSNIPKSAIGVLLNSYAINDMSTNNVCKGCNFDVEDYGDSDIIFKHTLTIPYEEKAEFIECETPETLLEKFPKAKMIFTGDYHKNFVHHKDGRYVVNSGCLLKQAIDFEDYQNGVYIVDTETCNIKWCPIDFQLPFNHTGEIKKEMDESIEKFVTGIKKEAVTLDFISSVKNELPNHEKPVQDKVETWIEEIGQ